MSGFKYKQGERIFLTAKDSGGGMGEVIGVRNHALPPAIGGGTEEQVNVRLDDGTVTGFIPITLVRLLKDQRPVTEQTHDPVQGLPRPELSTDDGRDDCLPQAGRAKPYLDPNPKTPETLTGVVAELEDVADWVKHGTLGSIKMRELRQKVISAAIKVKGCAATWEFEREHRPGMAEARHKLLFFGPSNADQRVTQEMEETGTLPEDQMGKVLDANAKEGWRVVFRHFDPSFVVQQWRIMLEKP